MKIGSIFRFLILLLSFSILIINCFKSKDDSLSASALLLIHTKIFQVNIVGDSLSERSEGFFLSAKLGSAYSVKDFSVSGRTQVDWISDVSSVINPNPDILIIELGTNDALNVPNAQFSANLNNLIGEIEKRTTAKIILTAIPLTDDPILQDRIRFNNLFVKSKIGKYTIADIEKEFEKNKNLFRLYPINDNIHPEPIGYEIMGEVYKSTILQSVPIQ